jgi:hypothetical protein
MVRCYSTADSVRGEVTVHIDLVLTINTNGTATVKQDVQQINEDYYEIPDMELVSNKDLISFGKAVE